LLKPIEKAAINNAAKPHPVTINQLKTTGEQQPLPSDQI